MPEDERYTMTWAERKSTTAEMHKDIVAIKEEFVDALFKGSDYFSEHVSPKLTKFMALNSFAILYILDDAIAEELE